MVKKKFTDSITTKGENIADMFRLSESRYMELFNAVCASYCANADLDKVVTNMHFFGIDELEENELLAVIFSIGIMKGTTTSFNAVEKRGLNGFRDHLHSILHKVKIFFDNHKMEYTDTLKRQLASFGLFTPLDEKKNNKNPFKDKDFDLPIN